MNNSAWFTELTDAEMEATAGGKVITAAELTQFLAGFKDGTIRRSQIAARASRVKPTEYARQQIIFNNWYDAQSRSDQRYIQRLGRSLGIGLS